MDFKIKIMTNLYLLLFKLKCLLLLLIIEGKSLVDQQHIKKPPNMEKLIQIQAMLKLMGKKHHQLDQNFIIRKRNLTMIKKLGQKRL